MMIEYLQRDRVLTRDHLVEHFARGARQWRDVLPGELA
jgi:hypothetical protein